VITAVLGFTNPTRPPLSAFDDCTANKLVVSSLDYFLLVSFPRLQNRWNYGDDLPIDGDCATSRSNGSRSDNIKQGRSFDELDSDLHL
jgi:hypothetical protein